MNVDHGPGLGLDIKPQPKRLFSQPRPSQRNSPQPKQYQITPLKSCRPQPTCEDDNEEKRENMKDKRMKEKKVRFYLEEDMEVEGREKITSLSHDEDEALQNEQKIGDKCVRTADIDSLLPDIRPRQIQH